jgi:hypothetical protein
MRSKPDAAEPRRKTGIGNERRFLMEQWTDLPPQPADYYRRQAAQLREAAEAVTTRAIKARLLDNALDCDRRAEEAERGEGPSSTT